MGQKGQDEEPRSPVLPRVRVTHHRAVAPIDLASPRLLPRDRAAAGPHQAADAGILARGGPDEVDLQPAPERRLFETPGEGCGRRDHPQSSEGLNVDLAPDGTVYGIESLNANEQLRASDDGALIILKEAF